MWNEYLLREIARQRVEELRAEGDAVRAAREACAPATPTAPPRGESVLERALMLRQVRWRLLC